MGLFTVRWLGGQWFVGTEEVSQRIEDGPWLDAWLAVNGAPGRQVLDVEFGLPAAS